MVHRMKSSFSAALIVKAPHGQAVQSVLPLHNQEDRACKSMLALYEMADDRIALVFLWFSKIMADVSNNQFYAYRKVFLVYHLFDLPRRRKSSMEAVTKREFFLYQHLVSPRA